MHAQKDARKLAATGLNDKATESSAVLAADPFLNLPLSENLGGDLDGAYARRINIQHRPVYELFATEGVARMLRMWSRYD